MSNKNLTMAGFAIKINKFFDVFKDYCETFDIDLFSDKFFVDPANQELNSERQIKEEFMNFFNPKIEEILEYRYDYCTNKSIKDIATITGADMPRIIAYLERIKDRFKSKDSISGLSKYGDVTEKTRVKYISSFEILKDFQLTERQLILSSLTKARAAREK